MSLAKFESMVNKTKTKFLSENNFLKIFMILKAFLHMNFLTWV
jgi:hypothetical protein